MSKLYYLASPYSHKDREIMNQRAEQATKAAVDLLKLGVVTFAPIPYNCHWEKYNLPSDWGFWQDFDKTFIDHMDAVVVLQLEGWDKSVGVTAEIAYAKEISIPVYYLSVEQIENKDIKHLTENLMKDTIKLKQAALNQALNKTTWG